MADGVAITAGAGTTVLTDDTGATGHAQVMKLAISTDASPTLIGADAQGLQVRPAPFTSRLTFATTSLTIAATAYTAGDTLGTILTVANAARTSGGTGVIRGLRMLDKGDVTGMIDVLFFRSTVTLALDNAVFAISDADADAFIGMVTVNMVDIGNNRVGNVNCFMPYDCAATSLFVAMITRTGHTFFAANADLNGVLYIQQD